MAKSNGNGTDKKVTRKPEERPDAAAKAFYSGLDSSVATFLKNTADLIRKRMNKSLIEIGANLLAVKKKVGHGQIHGMAQGRIRDDRSDGSALHTGRTVRRQNRHGVGFAAYRVVCAVGTDNAPVSTNQSIGAPAGR
jgi:hypothetical protein